MQAKDAVQQAISAFSELMPGIENVWLEEVELPDNEPFWYVTLSGIAAGRKENDPPQLNSSLASLIGPMSQLHYKTGRIFRVFKIDDNTQRVISMKMQSSK